MQSLVPLAILAVFPVLFLSAGIGAVACTYPYLRHMNKIFWLSALLLLCLIPFLVNENMRDLDDLLPALVAMTVLYLMYIAEKEKATAMARSRENISLAFTELANRMDSEDRRLCADLHDELNPCLIFAKRKIEECLALAHHQDNIKAILSRSVLEIDRAYSISRAIIKKVHVEIVDSVGLTAALEVLISHYHEISPLQPELKHNLTRKVEQAIDRTRSVVIYRIVREALLNAIRHSRAKRLTVSVDVQPRKNILYVTILDDGTGISDRVTPGVGLVDMRMRAMQAGGTLTIQRGENDCGTRVELSVPLS